MTDARAAKRRARAIVTAHVHRDDALASRLATEDPDPPATLFELGRMVAVMVRMFAARIQWSPADWWGDLAWRTSVAEARRDVDGR